jgi:hypothetical protein
MTAESRTQRYRIAETRLATSHLEGEAVILDLHRGTYFSLNRTASILWAALTGGATHDELVGALVGSDVQPAERQRVSQDVDTFLEMLRTEGMLDEQA